jgi:hypothetical protein
MGAEDDALGAGVGAALGTTLGRAIGVGPATVADVVRPHARNKTRTQEVFTATRS